MSAFDHRPRTLASSVLGFALLLPLGCNKADADATVNPAEPAPTTDVAPDSGEDLAAATDENGCRDWSDLDVANLPPLPQTDYTATLEQVWLTVHEKHYDPTLNCQDWPAIRVEYGNKLTEVKDEAAAFGVMREMLGRLGQSHLAVSPPREKVAGEPRAATKATDARVPLSVRIIEGEAVIVDAQRDGHRTGVPGGAAVVAIDDHEVAPMLAAMNESHDRPIEAAFLARRQIGGWLGCATGETKKIQYKEVGSDKVRKKSVRCHKVDVERVTMGNLANVPIVLDYRMLPKSKTGYITFNIWLVPLVPKIEAALEDLRAQGMTSLVIDLRGNPGGVGAMVVPLARQILSADTSLGEMHMRSGKQSFNVTAGEDPFTGPIALLVDEGTASTSEIFGQALQDLDRVTVVGAGPSQGAALPSVIEELPGGGILQYVVADYQSPGGIAVEGKGVQPDIVVPETRQDFANGRDPVLEAAIEALHKK